SRAPASLPASVGATSVAPAAASTTASSRGKSPQAKAPSHSPTSGGSAPGGAEASHTSSTAARAGSEHDPLTAQLEEMMGDAPVCDGCGHITVRNGACYKCLNCGNSMGCS